MTSKLPQKLSAEPQFASKVSLRDVESRPKTTKETRTKTTKQFDPEDFIAGMEHQINRRINLGIQQAMRVVLNKLDVLVNMKVGNLSKIQKERYDTFETKLNKQVTDLKREFRNIQLKRENFYKYTMYSSK